MQIYIHSFGYMYWDAEIKGALTIDCRSLPDPADIFDPYLSGLEIGIQAYLDVKSGNFLKATKEKIKEYIKSNRSEPVIIIRFGCTGGLHRSVYMAVRITQWLKKRGYQVATSHLDLYRYY